MRRETFPATALKMTVPAEREKLVSFIMRLNVRLICLVFIC